MIKAENIRKSFGNLQVLKGINLEVPEKKIYSIVGASGAGKTTLLQILGTLSKPDNGEIYIHEKKISSLNEKELARFRNREIGFVFQFHHLLPEFTALENVCIPAFIGKIQKAKAEKRAAELLDFLGLSERLHHKPSELSG
ncbi:MAG: ATP-binding cassette domain-containing protein, partial [Chlorobi bacterium]|nr:ATP-binding cassette domain-containing protein [Chlorobiota bacterium]